MDTRCEVARDQIVQRNLPLVRSLARSIQRKHGGHLDIEDLVNSGCIGLHGRRGQFRSRRGLAFSSFAVPRIRGAILDELRKQDSSTRLSRTRKRAISAATRAVAARELRAADEVDTAKQLGIDVATLQEWRAHVRRGTRPRWTGRSDPTTDGPRRLAICLSDEEADRAEADVAFEERRERLAEAMFRLPERQRLVLHLYYYERLQQARIAEILGVDGVPRLPDPDTHAGTPPVRSRRIGTGSPGASSIAVLPIRRGNAGRCSRLTVRRARRAGKSQATPPGTDNP